MTSRSAFTRVPRDTRVIVEDGLSRGVCSDIPEPDGDKLITVFGCGREGCERCSHIRKTVPERGGSFTSSRSTGALETFGPGNTLTVTRVRNARLDVDMKQFSQDLSQKELCKSCRSVNFTSLLVEDGAEHVLFPAFDDLVKSSRACPLCALVVSTLVDPFSFEPDDGRPVSLRAGDLGKTVEVSFPSREKGYEQLLARRCSTLQIYTGADGTRVPLGVTGRLPQKPNDPSAAQSWLAKCLQGHAKCRNINSANPRTRGPARLVNVGSPDGSQDPRIEQNEHCEGGYLTLTYCWGDPSSITKTTKENISHFQQNIPFDSLSQIFQDAIQFTRSLGVRYIWIDSLCIIQDSAEDKAAELPRMADIYEGALLAISASIATSGDSTLFIPRRPLNEIEVPESLCEEDGGKKISIYITDRILFGFSDDVSEGTLGARGWCFQERLLAPRLLHFGRDQLYWECHEGIWSESNTERQWYDEFGATDDGRLRMALQPSGAFSQHAGGTEGIALGDSNPTSRLDEEWENLVATSSQGTTPSSNKESRKLYDDWYEAVAAYTARQLSNPSDKLPALAGAAVRFNRLTNDKYVAGIWVNDLPWGLLWSRSAFEAVQVDPSLARRPGVGGSGELSGEENKGWRGAPSWSWASVDGSVHWVRHLQGPVHISHFAVMTKPGDDAAYQGLEWGAIRVQGLLVESTQLSWIRDEARDPETQSDFEKWLATLPASTRPRIDPDDPGWEHTLEAAGRSKPLYFLLVCSVLSSLGKGDAGGAAGVQGWLGYALTLRYWPAEGGFRRVGIAMVALGDFHDANLACIDIL